MIIDIPRFWTSS